MGRVCGKRCTRCTHGLSITCAEEYKKKKKKLLINTGVNVQKKEFVR